MNNQEDAFMRGLLLGPELSEDERRLELMENGIKKILYEKFGDKVYSDRNLSFLSQSVGFMIIRARQAAEKAVQYRDFKVGCSVFTVEDRRPEVFIGYNLKPNQGGAKLCAEQAALSSAIINSGNKEVVGIFVAGESQADLESGLNSPTLHPCANCRELVSEILKKENNNFEKVVLVTVGLKNDIFEVMTWEDLLKKHENKE